MDIDAETQKKIQELQSMEHGLQSILMQKQAFEMELNDSENALSEVTKSGDEVFKIVGQIMIKTNKAEVVKELTHKKELLTLRLKSIEKQEAGLSKDLDELKEEVMKKIK
jgi:prefoldin beta subunit